MPHARRAADDPSWQNALRNLKVRVSLGFGALAAGLVIVAVTSLPAMGGLRDDSRELAHRDLQTTGDLGALAQVFEGAGHLTAQHLYTFDGDLKTQDAVASRSRASSPSATRSSRPCRSA